MVAQDFIEFNRATGAPWVQHDVLAILQERRYGVGDIAVGGGGYDHHNHIGVFHSLLHVPRGHFQLCKPSRASFRCFQIDTTTLLDGADTVHRTVLKDRGEAHESEMGSHSFSAVTGADNSEARCVVHCGSPTEID